MEFGQKKITVEQGVSIAIGTAAVIYAVGYLIRSFK